MINQDRRLTNQDRRLTIDNQFFKSVHYDSTRKRVEARFLRKMNSGLVGVTRHVLLLFLFNSRRHTRTKRLCVCTHRHNAIVYFLYAPCRRENIDYAAYSIYILFRFLLVSLSHHILTIVCRGYVRHSYLRRTLLCLYVFKNFPVMHSSARIRILVCTQHLFSFACTHLWSMRGGHVQFYCYGKNALYVFIFLLLDLICVSPKYVHTNVNAFTYNAAHTLCVFATY